MLDILKYPDPFLRRTCTPVTVFDDELKDFCRQLEETREAAQGLGLAAPQVGDERRIFVLAAGLSGLKPRVVINPTVSSASRLNCLRFEGCLSLPGRMVQIDRPSRINVEFDTFEDDELKHYELRAVGGLMAQVFHHEFEHLNGRAFFDRIKDRNQKSLFARYA